MTVIGYFDRDLTTVSSTRPWSGRNEIIQTSLFNVTTGDEVMVVDASLRFKLKSMQYIGPILVSRHDLF